MFCPICGCMMRDNLKTCPECGYLILGKDKSALNEKQIREYSSDKVSQIGRNKKRYFYTIKAAGIISSIILICTYFMPWAQMSSPVGEKNLYISDIFNWTYNDWEYLKFIPILVVIFGIITLIGLLVGSRGWIGVLSFVFSFTSVILSVVFSIQMNNFRTLFDSDSIIYYSAEYAAYFSIVLNLIICGASYYIVTYKRKATL